MLWRQCCHGSAKNHEPTRAEPKMKPAVTAGRLKPWSHSSSCGSGLKWKHWLENNTLTVPVAGDICYIVYECNLPVIWHSDLQIWATGLILWYGAKVTSCDLNNISPKPYYFCIAFHQHLQVEYILNMLLEYLYIPCITILNSALVQEGKL